MANTCKTCRHPEAEQINRDLIANVTLREITEKHQNLTIAGLNRHKYQCLDEMMDDVRAEKRAGLLADVDEIRKEIRAIAVRFPDHPNVRVGLVGKMLDVITQEAKLTGAYLTDQVNPANIQLEINKYFETHTTPEITQYLLENELPIQVLPGKQ